MKALHGKRIAVDMDEVLFPMISRLDKHYKNVYKRNPPMHSPKQYDYSKHYNMSLQESMKFVESFYHTSIAYETQPLPNAVHKMKMLKKDNKLVVVTGRQIYKDCKDVTYHLLEKHFDNIFDSVIFTNSYSLSGEETPKSEVCTTNNLDVLIDDSVYNCTTCSKFDIECILFGNYEWNKYCNDFRRIESWEKN